MVRRDNAVDKIAGYMFLHGVTPQGKMFSTTGRLTIEMVIKTIQLEIPILMSLGLHRLGDGVRPPGPG